MSWVSHANPEEREREEAAASALGERLAFRADRNASTYQEPPKCDVKRVRSFEGKVYFEEMRKAVEDASA
jgi:hypothetical protein